MGLAPPCGLAAHCARHCNTSVAQGIKGPCGFDVIPSFLPAPFARINRHKPDRPTFLISRKNFGHSGEWCWAVPCGTCNTRQGLRSLPQLRERLTARTDDNHAAPGLTVQHFERETPKEQIRMSKSETIFNFLNFFKI